MVVEEVPETAVRGNPSSEVPEGHVWESFLRIADGPDRLVACVKLNDKSSVHMAPYINKVFNSNLEPDSTERLRRVRGEGRCPGPRVAPPPADEVAPGTPFATLVTDNSPSQGTCTSAGVFSLLKCTLEGTRMGLKHTQGAKLSGEFLLFSRRKAEVALQWSGKFGPTIDVDAASTTFVDLDITDEGRWEVDPNILNTFIDAAAQDIEYCPVIVAEPYDGGKACELQMMYDDASFVMRQCPCA